jgi:Holliday junction DNA helicase RuvA
MISTLRGRLIQKHASAIVIETAGVGYEVLVPLRILGELPDEGREVFLYIHSYVRDGLISLYGFLRQDERSVFRTLLNVSGIGPKIALNILSGTTIEDFYSAVEREDTSFLTRLPGIGKKTARRIIFELKQALPSVEIQKDSLYEDALSALVNLGYKKSDAREALERVYNKDGDIETIIKDALRYLNK